MIPLLNARIPAIAKEAIGRVLDSGYVGGGSNVVRQFEEAAAAALKVDNPECVVSTNSCTSALELALHVAGVRDKYVVTTPMTFQATTTAILRAGAKPLWADVLPNSCLMDHDDTRNKVKANGDTVAAVMSVAWAGWSPNLPNIGLAAGELPLIIDAAQAFGAELEGRPIHKYAEFTCYSFAPTKHITTGDGGLVVCMDIKDAERIRKLAWFGMRRKLEPGERVSSDQDIAEAGWKAHMNSMSAAMGLAGLEDIYDVLETCRRNARIFSDRLWGRVKTDSAIGLVRQTPSPYTYTIFVDDPGAFTDHMTQRGVAVGQPHRRNDAYSFVREHKMSLPWTEYAQQHYVSLPVGWWVSTDDVNKIADEVLAYHHTRP